MKKGGKKHEKMKLEIPTPKRQRNVVSNERKKNAAKLRFIRDEITSGIAFFSLLKFKKIIIRHRLLTCILLAIS